MQILKKFEEGRDFRMRRKNLTVLHVHRALPGKLAGIEGAAPCALGDDGACETEGERDRTELFFQGVGSAILRSLHMSSGHEHSWCMGGRGWWEQGFSRLRGEVPYKQGKKSRIICVVRDESREQQYELLLS